MIVNKYLYYKGMGNFFDMMNVFKEKIILWTLVYRNTVKISQCSIRLVNYGLIFKIYVLIMKRNYYHVKNCSNILLVELLWQNNYGLIQFCNLSTEIFILGGMISITVLVVYRLMGGQYSWNHFGMNCLKDKNSP